MNLLYLCDEYPPGKHGGIGTYVRLIARQMVKLGHNVVVAGLYSPGYGGLDEFSDEGVKVYRFRRGFDYKLFSDEQSLISRIGIRLLKDSGLIERDMKKSLAAYKNKLEQLITEYKIDIIEMPDYNDYIRFCGSYIPFPQLSIPVVVKMNGSITYFTKEANKQVPVHLLKMEQAILKQASAVSSASKYTANKSSEYLSYTKEIEVLYNGIKTDLPTRNIPKSSKQVIFTGTLVAKKGIYQLIKAWNIVNKNMPDARLLVLGKGSQQKVMAHLTDEAKASVSFKGHVSTDELYDHLSASAISIFPSYAEAFALAPLEAMACDTAVINSNRTSGPELIDDKINGLLIDPDNIDQIASSILYLLNNPDVCARLAKAGNEKVKEQFEIGKIAAKTIQFYNMVLKSVS
jgi:glycosyltransferase involved in cell wall biosynthesis